MKLLISVINREEAINAVNAGTDILDIKNPKEGSLGANFPWVIKSVSDEVHEIAKDVEISATIGDAPYKPGTMALAALGCTVSGVDYVKVGLFGTSTEAQAVDVMKAVSHSVKDYNSDVKVVCAGYSDAHRIHSIPPETIPNVAIASEADIAMLDTGVKDGKSLLDFFSIDQLIKFISQCREHGILSALAGSLNKNHILKLIPLKPDVIGVRSVVCTSFDRLHGHLDPKKVEELNNLIMSK
ncbi:MAG: (5-formylfuran-3-yl)methyl phosphate synthase [Promethearchaeota archaeon]